MTEESAIPEQEQLLDVGRSVSNRGVSVQMCFCPKSATPNTNYGEMRVGPSPRPSYQLSLKTIVGIKDAPQSVKGG